MAHNNLTFLIRRRPLGPVINQRFAGPRIRLADGRLRQRDLLGELQGGEAKLVFPEGDGLGVHREINVVKVRITRQDTQERALVEARQVFADGRERSRGLPLSEKIKADEEPLAAARRGILEELRSALSYGSGGVHLRPDTLHTWEERRDSASYPSLPTYYKIHQVDAVVADEGRPALPVGLSKRIDDLHAWLKLLSARGDSGERHRGASSSRRRTSRSGSTRCSP